MRNTMKRHTLAHFAFFRFLRLFNGALAGSESPSPQLSILLTNAIHASVHGQE